MADNREPYGQIVHEIRLAYNAELPHPRGVLPWPEREAGQQEMDMRIGSAVAARAVDDAGFAQADLAAQVIRLQVRLDDAVHEVTRRIARECERRGNALPPSDERTAWLSAAGVALAARNQERDDEKEAGRG